MELMPLYIFLVVFVALTVFIFIRIDKKFLRFDSIKDFAKLDEYLYQVEINYSDIDIAEQNEALYNYNGNIIRLHAIIFKTNMSAAKCFNECKITRGFAMFAAKEFIISKKRKTNIRLFKKTFLLVEGDRNADYNDFYRLVLSCLKTKSKH